MVLDTLLECEKYDFSFEKEGKVYCKKHYLYCPFVEIRPDNNHNYRCYNPLKEKPNTDTITTPRKG